MLPRKKLQALMADEHHCSRLPAWFMVWFVVGIGLFCRDSYRQVFRWLQPMHGAPTPPRSTLCEARKRLGAASLRHLLEKVVELLGAPATAGAFYHQWRLMGIDGFVLDVADTSANERAFGRPQSGRTAGAFPQVRCVSLCEAGSHVLYKTIVRGEIRMAEVLMRFLTSEMLLLWDRNFLSFALLALVRWLTRIIPAKRRVHEATPDVTVHCVRHRLACWWARCFSARIAKCTGAGQFVVLHAPYE